MPVSIEQRWEQHKKSGGSLTLEQFRKRAEKRTRSSRDGEPNWSKKCTNCGQLPTVGDFGLCGPCCFGERDTAGGKW